MGETANPDAETDEEESDSRLTTAVKTAVKEVFGLLVGGLF